MNLDKQAHIWHPKRPRYLRVRSAAMYCGVSPRLLWTAIREGSLLAYRFRGYRVVLLRETELRMWLEGNLEPYTKSMDMTERRD